MPKSNGPKFSINDDPRFNDADAARAFVEAQRWPNGPICPHCGVEGEAYRIESKGASKTRKGLWKCAACREQFTVTVGTIMEDSHIPLHKWLLAFHLLCSSKKGMSAHQIHRMIGVTYKSAWFMMHRIRYAMTQEPLSSKLSGVVEIDETYVGGKFRTPHKATREWKQREVGEEPPKRRNPVGNKAAVVSVLQRSGRVQSTHVERVTAENLKPIVEQMVCESAHIMTDSSTVLNSVTFGTDRKHDFVNHNEKEYVRREGDLCITTNGVEGYFATLKRGINGVYHHVGKHHLHRYLSEFDFRYNAREVDDVERRDLAIQQVGGKRLKYRDSCGNGNQTDEVPF